MNGRLDDDLKGMDDPLLLDNGKFGFRSSALDEVEVLSVRMRGSNSLSLGGSQLDLVAESFSEGLRCSRSEWWWWWWYCWEEGGARW